MNPFNVDEEPTGTNEEINVNFQSLIRLQKSIIISSNSVGPIDGKVITPEYYNKFNYSLLNGEWSGGKLVFGVVSSNPGEGKTLVASNLAVSLAMAYMRETVLVDLNFQRPRIHGIFGAPPTPGILNALDDTIIQVTSTKVKNLYVLPTGNLLRTAASPSKQDGGGLNTAADSTKMVLGLDRLAEFKNVFFSLEQFFDIIIFDLPAVSDNVIPNLFLNQINGLIVVITSGVTKKEELDKMLLQIDSGRILGFVMNKTQI
jgi:protein-tyrosine kinase